MWRSTVSAVRTQEVERDCVDLIWWAMQKDAGNGNGGCDMEVGRGCMYEIRDSSRIESGSESG